MSDYVTVRFHGADGAHDAPLDVVRLRDGWTVDQIDDSGPRFHGTQVSVGWWTGRPQAMVFTPRQIDRDGGRNFHDFPAEPLAPRPPLQQWEHDIKRRRTMAALLLCWHRADRARAQVETNHTNGED